MGFGFRGGGLGRGLDTVGCGDFCLFNRGVSKSIKASIKDWEGVYLIK